MMGLIYNTSLDLVHVNLLYSVMRCLTTKRLTINYLAAFSAIAACAAARRAIGTRNGEHET